MIPRFLALKKILFWIFTLFGVPLLFLALLEGGLTIGGYGKDYDYFRTVDIDGKTWYQDNPGFGLQFFSPDLNRTPLENMFSAEHPPELLRVFVLGGSAARGFPDPEFGFARLLEAILTDALPDRRVEVINTAMTAINSHVVYEIAKAIPDGAADFSIILLGNNEVVGPFGPGTVFSGFSSSLGLIRAGQALRRSRTGQLLTNVIAGMKTGGQEEKATVWRGMDMFSHNKVAETDPRLLAVYRHFAENLVDIIGQLQGAGSRVLLSSVPVNLRDSAPFATLHMPLSQPKQERRWETTLARARSLYYGKDWAGTEAELDALEKMDPGYADLYYMRGVSRLKQDSFGPGVDDLVRARDLDALRFRADTGINRAISGVADQFADELDYIDSVAVFDKASQPQPPGRGQFYEHVHFSFGGNYLLARTFAREILDQLGRGGDFNMPAQDELAQRTGYPNQKTEKVLARLVDMVQKPPFSRQLNRDEQVKTIRKEYQETRASLGSREDRIRALESVVAQHKDWRVEFELARLYQAAGRAGDMKRALDRVIAINPNHFIARVMMGATLMSDGHFDDALSHLHYAQSLVRGNASREGAVQIQMAVAEMGAGRNAEGKNRLEAVAQDEHFPLATRLGAYGRLIENAQGQGQAVEPYLAELRSVAMAVRNTPDHKQSLDSLLARLFRAAGDVEQAAYWSSLAGK